MNVASCTCLWAFGALVFSGFSAAGHAVPPQSPLAPPDFSIDGVSPSTELHGLHPGDVLERGTLRPVPVLPAWALALFSEQDDIDALSGPHEGIAADDTLTFLFSVDRESVGGAEPAASYALAGLVYNVYDQALRGHAAGDTFFVIDPFRKSGLVPPNDRAFRNNLLGLNNFNEGGNDLVLQPPTHALTWLEGDQAVDRIDALAHLPRDEGGRVDVVYFSLGADTPMLTAAGLTGGDVLVAGAGQTASTACCLGTECVQVSLDECLAQGGLWWPTGSCESCQAEGACCLQGGCLPLPLTVCMVIGGDFEGDETTCVETVCSLPLTACCLPDETCIQETPSSCQAMGGMIPTFGLSCEEVECAQPMSGACCFPDGSCIEFVPVVPCQSIGGTPLGPNTTCSGAGCVGEPLFACCLPDDECLLETLPGCLVAGGVPYPGLTCEEIQCSLSRAKRPIGQNQGGWASIAACDASAPCCFPSEGCTVLDVVECASAGGHPLEGETSCDDCEDVSACCLPGGCVPLNLSLCELIGGAWMGPGSSCKIDACVGEVTGVPLLVYASHLELGLHPDDDIDALVVFDEDADGHFNGDDLVLFSLAPGSVSLTTIEGASKIGAAADVFVARPGIAPALFGAAQTFGLGAQTDNLDALEAVIRTAHPAQQAIQACNDQVSVTGGMD